MPGFPATSSTRDRVWAPTYFRTRFFPACSLGLGPKLDKIAASMKKSAVLLLALAGTLSAQVTFTRLMNANKEPQNWLTYSGSAMSQRYSLLTQITPDNAKNLDQAWTFKTQTNEKFEATPLVVDGVMYTVVPPPPAPRGGGRGRGGAAAGGRGGRGPAPAAAGEAGLVPAGPAPAAAPAPRGSRSSCDSAAPRRHSTSSR